VPPSVAFNAPAGKHYLTIDVQVTNLDRNKAQLFCGFCAFHLLDSANRQYDENPFIPGLGASAPEGQIEPGHSLRGFVAFEVPDGTTGLKLRVQGRLTAAGAVYTL
jgi:hypothetical protein